MRKFEVRYTDGTCTTITATNEDMARQFAMENKWGKPEHNKTFPTDFWHGSGLSVKEVFDA
jgi:hypothetical protein